MGRDNSQTAAGPSDGPPPAGWLADAPPWQVAGYATVVAFVAYFCAYGVRKPFDAVTLTGERFLDTRVDLKTACVLGQILGYMASKYAGARVCAEVPRRRRAAVLAGCVLWSEAALVVFAVAPPALKPLAMLANGLTLGVVWGLVVRYLEGRRLTDVMLVGMSASFILAGAVTKDVGLFLLTGGGLPEGWMPAAAGALFLGPYLLGVWLLDRLPPPSAADVAARAARADMTAADRRAFLRRMGPGLFLLFAAYLLLTAYRDFRDYYGREIFIGLGYPSAAGLFTWADRWALVGTLAALAALNAIGSHRRALAVTGGFIVGGFSLIGSASAAFQGGWLDGRDWMAAVGAGLYLAYVPFGVVLFERLMAATRLRGTSVFAVQLADGIGYTGSVVLQLYRDLAHPGVGRLEFFLPLSYAVSVTGVALTLAGGAAVWRRAVRPSPPSSS